MEYKHKKTIPFRLRKETTLFSAQGISTFFQNHRVIYLLIDQTIEGYHLSMQSSNINSKPQHAIPLITSYTRQ